MKLFTVNKNMNGKQDLLTVNNDISLTCAKATKSHLVVIAVILINKTSFIQRYIQKRQIITFLIHPKTIYYQSFKNCDE